VAQAIKNVRGPADQFGTSVVRPPDFDEFWAATLRRDAAAPVLLDVRPESTALKLVEIWDVTFAGFGGEPVRAWYTRPAGVSAPLPAVVEYAGYGRVRGLPGERLTWAVAGYAHLLMDVRGQGSQYGTGGDTPDPYGPGQGGGPWPITWGILDPEDYYYRRLIADAVAAVAAVRELPGIDPDRVVAAGNSQGGALALSVAGLVPDLAALISTAPLLCHIQRAIDITDAAPYGEIVNYLAVNREHEAAVRRTLSYVDGVSFARRAKAPAHFGTGLRDNICPPSGVFADYNQYGQAHAAPAPEQNTINVYPFNHHEGGDAYQVRQQLRWLSTLLREPVGAH